MKPRAALVAPAIIIIILAVAAFAYLQWQPGAFSGTTNNPPAPAQISVATSTISTSTSDYTIDASYPQFGIPAIDAQIKAWIENGIGALVAQANQDKPAANGYPTYEFTSQFSNVYIGPDFISTELALSEYTGGAHGLPVIIGATFDRATGASTTLDEALALTGMTLDQVASSSKQQLAENPNTPPTGMWASGSDPTPDNYKTFLINKNSVVFIFQPYQVAPYAAGAPEVTIPRVK